ncbi:CRISPR-associated endoribonuclease Cas6 [Thermus sp.]|uniref:CRISPR-associated endoribonuclease Cas6 n=1 Tax=Thermus sp. TaxID=275 RepID=UPI00298F1A2F|nr:CRISPR-associated endoribonuclease Cas6 [Thermus sp.]MDW8358818.1 CRISPR-associated endoribonuclease Cas6 [Thermus sp.]
MPYAVVLELVGEKPPPYLGKHAHGLFFALLSQMDSELATRLHVAPRKPFTITPLGEGQGTLLLRLTMLDDELLSPFLHTLLQIAPKGLPLGDTSYRLVRVLSTPEGHPLAGRVSWEALRDAPSVTEVALAFRTPTVFTTSKPGGRTRYTPLPEPRLIFRSLLEKWQAHSPYPYAPEEAAALLEVLELELELSSFRRLRFFRVQVARGFFPGFTGEVQVKLHGDCTEAQRTLGILQTYAFYAGVGAKTTYGLGLTVPLSTKSS